jgi:hypothetical protein
VKRKVPGWEPFAREPIMYVERKNRKNEERKENDGDGGEEKGNRDLREGKF